MVCFCEDLITQMAYIDFIYFHFINIESAFTIYGQLKNHSEPTNFINNTVAKIYTYNLYLYANQLAQYAH